MARKASVAESLSLRRSSGRGRLASLYDASTFRPGLRRAFQMQPEAYRGLSRALVLYARAISGPGHSGHGRFRSYQAALLSESQDHQPDRDSAIGSASRL